MPGKTGGKKFEAVGGPDGFNEAPAKCRGKRDYHSAGPDWSNLLQ